MAKNIAGKRFFNLFFLFFSEFLTRFDYERNSGIKFFCRFLGLSHPVSAKNNTGKIFFNFLNFFAIFFAIFFPRWSMNRILDLNFYLSFSASFNPFWIEIMPELTSWIFWIFLLFFLEFSSSGWVWTEFGLKFFCFFFGLSHPVLAKKNARKRFF